MRRGVLARWFGRASRRRTVIYDADCGICQWCRRLLQRLDVFGVLTLVGSDERERIPASIDEATLARTLVVIDARGRRHEEERAVFEAARALPFGIVAVAWLVVPGLHLLGRALYRTVARHRHRISGWLGLGVCAPGRRPASGSSTT